MLRIDSKVRIRYILEVIRFRLILLVLMWVNIIYYADDWVIVDDFRDDNLFLWW